MCVCWVPFYTSVVCINPKTNNVNMEQHTTPTTQTQAHPTTNSATIVKSGLLTYYIYPTQFNVRYWKRRWIVLTENSIEISCGKLPKPVLCIELKSTYFVQQQSNKLIFSIITPTTKFYFRSNNEDDFGASFFQFFWRFTKCVEQ